MKLTTFAMIRVYLQTASLAAVVFQTTVVLPMIVLFNVSEDKFATLEFRVIAAIWVAIFVALIRCAAFIAFNFSITRGHIKSLGGTSAVSVSLGKRTLLLWFAILHIKFARKSVVA
jgi:hypothetical protein